MARRFVRVDLSGVQDDFRPLAVEPGLPLLDAAGGNARIVNRWLGRLAAAPAWEGPSVEFYVQDDQGGRLEEVYCQPATGADLQEFLADELEILKRRMADIRPESPSERELAGSLTKAFGELVEDPSRPDLDDYFFRYRDVHGRWRLVWCWGYQRVDREAAPAVICSDPECSLLFLRRPGRRAKCPSCQAALAAKEPDTRPWKSLALLALILLLALAGLLWFYGRPGFVAEADLSMVVGEVADIPLEPSRGQWQEIVSDEPRVVEILGGRFVGRAPGRATVAMRDGRGRAVVDVRVHKGGLELTEIDPEEISVPLDGTLRVTVRGRGPDNRPLEIVPDVLTVAHRPAARFVELDAATLELKGLAPTEPEHPQKLTLRLGSDEVSAPVEVAGHPQSLELLPAGPLPLPVGQRADLAVQAHYDENRQAGVGAERVQWLSEPAGAPGITLESGRVTVTAADGPAVSVWARYGGCDSNRVTIQPQPAKALRLQPVAQPAEPQVGQAGRITLQAADGTPADDLGEFQSDHPEVLAVDPRSGLFRALAPGEAKIRVTHPAAAEPVELPVRVVEPPAAPAGERPTAVRILSDQGPAVSLPVGGRFDDFRVEADYADGSTRLVTHKAALGTRPPSQQAPVAAEAGRLVGLRPGQASVVAEFQGINSPTGLTVTVLEKPDYDEIRVEPSPIVLQPGERIALDAVGYKADKSIGSLAGLPGIAWHSSDPEVARVDGNRLRAVAVGEAEITGKLGDEEFEPAEVQVVEAAAEPLRADPQQFRIQVGDSLHLGSDLQVWRGNLDVSTQCMAWPAEPDLLRFDPAAGSLVGLAPGASPVTIGFGEKLAHILVEVLPRRAMPLVGVAVEPAEAALVPGQAVGLRVLAVGADGRRVDRTTLASLVSSDPNVVSIHGSLAYAHAPGMATVTVSLPESDKTATALIEVRDGAIRELRLDPPALYLGVGDRARVRVLGVTDRGTYQMFPQPGLSVEVGGPKPEAIRVDEEYRVEGRAIGEASLSFSYGGLSRTLPVAVHRKAYQDLQIEPGDAAIRPGDMLSYEVTAWREGRRYVVPRDQVQLRLGDSKVATVENGLVRGLRPGRTTVRASVSGEQAQAALTVSRDASVRKGWEYDRLILRPDEMFTWGSTWSGLSALPDVSGLAIVPAAIGLEVGQQTPPLRVTARDAQGQTVDVPAQVESLDPQVLAPAGEGRFVARAVGSTQLRARYGTQEALADVAVHGARFLSIASRLQEGKDSFQVTLDVRAAKAEGALEYRLFLPGQTPPDRWQLSEESGDGRRVTLESPAIRYGERNARYTVLIESRDPAGSVQQYPFSFRLAPSIERTDATK